MHVTHLFQYLRTEMGVTWRMERYTSGFLAYQLARMLCGDDKHHVCDDDDEQFPAFGYSSVILSVVIIASLSSSPLEGGWLEQDHLEVPVAKWFPNANLYDPRDHSRPAVKQAKRYPYRTNTKQQRLF